MKKIERLMVTGVNPKFSETLNPVGDKVMGAMEP
jgi:hypothetical protein